MKKNQHLLNTYSIDELEIKFEDTQIIEGNKGKSVDGITWEKRAKREPNYDEL